METQSIAKNLVYQRKLKGYTQEELSEKTQVTIRTIQRIENGDVNPHLQTIKLLATALDVEIEDLLIIENPKEEIILKKWLILLHGTPFLGFIIPLANILFPLFIWIHKRDDNKIYYNHGIKIINFQITMSILYIFSIVALLTIEKWGFFLFISVLPFSVVVMIYNITKSFNSQKCYYPLSIPFLRSKKKNPMKKLSTLMICLFLISTSVFGQKTEIKKLDNSTITTNEIDRIVTKLIETANVQGLSLGILNNKKIVYTKAYGYKNKTKNELLDTSTVLYAASFSKPVFAFLTLKLVQDKILDLDKPIYEYLSKPLPLYEDYAELANDNRWKLITTRMCLSHTTGLPNTRWINVRTGEIDTVGPMKIYFKPGTRYAYSGEGLKLLQLVEEEITGKTVEELAIEKIFKPIGMNRTGFIWYEKFDDNYAIGHLENDELNPKKKRTEPVASGSLVTTISDYSKFVEYVVKGKGLNKKLWTMMISPQIKITSKYQFPTITDEITTDNESINLSYGLGWGLLKCKYGRAFFKEGHDDAWRNYNINFVDKGISIIIMTNSANGELIFKELLGKIIGDTITPWEWERYTPYDFTL
jgi:CubicO group peptidase (beta-lactamase class C family)/transcriptional regulator with XRE-family HTH domain